MEADEKIKNEHEKLGIKVGVLQNKLNNLVF